MMDFPKTFTKVVGDMPATTIITEAEPTSTSSAPFFTFAGLLVFFDIFIGRYTGSSSYGLWFLFLFLYSFIGVLYWYAYNDYKKGLIIGLLGYVWPLLGLVTDYLPNNKHLAVGFGFLLFMCHPYLWMFLREHPRLAVTWSLIMLVGTFSWYIDDIRAMADARGFSVNLVSPRVVAIFYYEQMIKFGKTMIGQIMKGYTDTIRIATGEDMEQVRGEQEKVKQDLGVSLTNAKSVQSMPLAGEDVYVIAQLEASTIDVPVILEQSCEAVTQSDDKTSVQNRIPGQVDLPLIEVEGEDREEIECVIPGGVVDKNLQQVDMSTTFRFTSSATLKNDFIDKQLGRRIEKEKNPFSSYGVRNTRARAQYTGGPVAIGIETKTLLPITVDPDKPVMKLPMAVSVTNKAAKEGSFGSRGKVESLDHIYLMLTKPWELKRFGASLIPGEGIEKVSCASFTHQVCDDKQVVIYDVSKSAIDQYAGEYRRGFVTFSFRLEAPTSEILSQPVTTHTFTVFTSYVYKITATARVHVQEGTA